MGCHCNAFRHTVLYDLALRTWWWSRYTETCRPDEHYRGHPV